MKNLLLSKPSKNAVPVVPVVVKNFEAWLKTQDAMTVQWIKTQDFKAKAGAHCVVPDASGKVGVVVACLSDPVSLWDIAGLATKLPQGSYKLVWDGAVEDQEKLALGWVLGAYKMTRYKKAEKEPVELAISAKIDFERVRHLAETIFMVREMINTPANDMGPAEIAAMVEAQGKIYGAKVSQIVGDALLKKGYGGIHAVGRASVKPPRLVDLTWGDPKHPKVTLVGKGVCFDSGGLDIKPPSGMLKMKKDMAGSACALGLATLVMQNKLPVRLRLLIPTVENVIAGNAYRPDDIITMKNGKTVEITNTDAEGRLILADALTDACADKPDLLLDFATLTGAARTALGTEISAFFTHDDEIGDSLMAHAKREEDPMWRMPLYKDYGSHLDSPLADMVNAVNSPYGGAITAALFLDRFVEEKTPWVHVDFMAANTTAKPGRPEGGEAMALRAAYRLIEDFSKKAGSKKGKKKD